MPSEKRRYPRAQISWPVTLTGLDGLVVGVTQNLSLAGTLVYCPEMPIIGDKFSLVFKPASRQPLLANAERVWSNNFTSTEVMMHAMGASFEHIPDPERRLLSKIISDHLKLEYMKQFFRRRLRFYRFAIFNKMQLHKLKCHRCKTVLLLGPAEMICPVCENLLPKYMKF